ncbi:HipA domain-containing protein [Vibrio aestuarianus]|uniref:HipA domain-containing protein n=1 Tax=Vibrio aestuarianus TaxID=28171 RepID=A0A9X4IT93_9VIBR|nr:HipA domain-containing protein [Vibrio aestuarianus]MDE1242189.1 HipA domain-containing protein [Vibrio aestuarianus]
MFPSDRCLISLKPISETKVEQEEYAQGQVKTILGSVKNQMRLDFTRHEFATEQPVHQKGMSISGYQPKLSLAIKDTKLHVVNNDGEFILKPSPEDFPHLAENEHACMLVMKALGFDVPPFGLTRFAEDDEGNSPLAFLIKRYDRDSDGQRIHQVQLDAEMNIKEKYGKTKDDSESYISYERIGKFLFENIDTSLKMKREYFLRVLWANILGNNDLHLRNFGVLHFQTGKVALAPIYDYVSVAPYSGYISIEDCSALPLLISEEGQNRNTKGFSDYSTYTGADFKDLGLQLGLKMPMINKLFDEVNKQKDKVFEIYESSLMPEEHVAAVKEWIVNRLYYLTK